MFYVSKKLILNLFVFFSYIKVVIGIVGPSASGKSSIGQELVEKFQYCIINADSQQIYKNLNILKATPDFLYNHYLYSILEENDRVNAYQYVQLVNKTIKDIQDKKICFIGGTGLYYSVLQNGISNIDYIDREISEDEVNCKLSKIAPEILNTYKDYRRRKKALLIFEQTNKIIYESFDNQQIFQHDLKLYALIPEKSVLWNNIETRLNRDFDKMINEVQNSNFDNFIIGYLFIKQYLSNQITKDQCKELIFIKTRQYCKRQITYIKNCLKIEKTFTNPKDLLDHISLNQY